LTTEGDLGAQGALTVGVAYTGEDERVPPLLDKDNYATFASLDLDYFLGLAGSRIREFCGWHIWPSLTHTRFCDMTGDGTILLPTRHATAVVSVTPTWAGATVVDPSSYALDQRGWISFTPFQYGFAPTPASTSLWPIDTVRLFDAYKKHDMRMQVTFTHGYDTIPDTVQGVAHELVMRVLEKPSGIASEVNAGPYRFKFNEFGFVLSEDQKNRLSHYKLPGIR
jgi:hypothetical protein